MNLQKNRNIIFAALAMLVIILDSRTALAGAIQGINMCIYTVIPSLFPLFVLSNYLTQALSGVSIGIMRFIAKICGVPKGGESLLLVGLIGGYPVGAQCVRKAYDNHLLSKQDSHRLLGFCSNAGPAFIFGMTGRLFSSAWVPWAIWSIQIISSFTVGMVLNGKRDYSISDLGTARINLVTSVRQSITALTGVCAWVILFRVFSVMLTKWALWIFPIELQIIIQGAIELVNGCNGLYQITDESLRFVLCSVFLSFGGLCVCMQTMSVVGDLGMRSYYKGKLLQTVISGIISYGVSGILFPGNKEFNLLFVLLFVIFIIGVFNFKKSVAFIGKMFYTIKKPT